MTGIVGEPVRKTVAIAARVCRWDALSTMRMPLVCGVRLCLLLMAVELSGCGFGEPSDQPVGPERTSTIVVPQVRSPTKRTVSPASPVHGDTHEPAPEQGGTIPPAARRAEDGLGAGAASPTPQRALTRFADLYMNWTPQSLRGHQLELAKISIDGARLAAQQSAAQAQGATAVGQNAVSNSGEVVSLSQGSAGASGYWVIVTDEQTRGNDSYRDLPARVHVTYARVRHIAGGWVIAAWEPQD